MLAISFWGVFLEVAQSLHCMEFLYVLLMSVWFPPTVQKLCTFSLWLYVYPEKIYESILMTAEIDSSTPTTLIRTCEVNNQWLDGCYHVLYCRSQLVLKQELALEKTKKACSCWIPFKLIFLLFLGL